jgi:hypothetical protein
MEEMMMTSFRVTFIPLCLIAASLAMSELGLRSAQAQDFACTAYDGPNYRGESWGLPAGGGAGRSKLNNRISSFRIVRGCYVVAFTAADYQGDSRRFEGNVPRLAVSWNNEVTSWQCNCGSGVRPRPRPQAQARPQKRPPQIID